MTQGKNICWACQHLQDETTELPGGGLTGVCKAFPGGIPLEIFADGFDHREPFPGDQGIRFLPFDEQWGEEAIALVKEL